MQRLPTPDPAILAPAGIDVALQSRRGFVTGAAALMGSVALIGGCASSPRGDGGSGSASRLDDAQAREVTMHAMTLVGTPYRWGGNTPSGGFDCSGLIVYVYLHSAQLGLPRTVAELQHAGEPIDRRSIRAGDLVFFGRRRGAATHAGIYVGDGRFVHAPSNGGRVGLSRMDTGYWGGQFLAVRRP
jgi:cell wall-associated NlpC family hydrolase